LANKKTIDDLCKFIDNKNKAGERNKLYFCDNTEIINLLHKDSLNETQISLLAGLLESLDANQYTYYCIPVIPTDSADPCILICIISRKRAIVFCDEKDVKLTMVTGSVLGNLTKAYRVTDNPLNLISTTYCKVNNIKLTKSDII